MVKPAVLVALCLPCLGAALNSSPVQKIVELLEDMKMKTLNDLAKEEKEVAEYSQFCDDATVEKVHAIKAATLKIEELNAKIEDASSQVSNFQEEIASLGTEMAAKDQDLASAAMVRKQEKQDFDATEKELLESIDQLERAVIAIKRGTSFTQAHAKSKSLGPEATSSLKAAMQVFANIVDAGRVGAGVRRKLQGLMQDAAEAADGEDNYQKLGARSSSSMLSNGGVMGAIEEMKQKAEETLSETRMAEMKANHNYQMMTASLQNGRKIAADKLSTAKSKMAEMSESNGKANGELVETKKTKSSDEQYLQELEHDCKQSAKDWEERQESAHGETEAIGKAIEVLAKPAKVLVQSTGPDDFADETADTPDEKDELTRQRLVAKLKDMSTKFGSYALMEMAGAASSDPFGKVRNLISEMIAKLVEDANAEATQKSFCDEETAKSKKSQEEKSMTADKLQSRLNAAAAAKAELQQAVKELQSELAALDVANAEATKVRQEEHATFQKESKEYKEAAAAVEQALRVLKKYYGVAAAPSMIQRKAKQPDLGGSQGDAAGVVLGLLETCEQDFSRMYMEVQTVESEKASAYEKLLQDGKVSKAAKEAEVRGAESNIKSLSVTLQSTKEDYEMTSKELDSVLAYLDKLKPQCEAKVMTYEEKKAKRQAEIDGLKEALEIVSEGGSLVQLRGARVAPHKA